MEQLSIQSRRIALGLSFVGILWPGEHGYTYTVSSLQAIKCSLGLYYTGTYIVSGGRMEWNLWTRRRAENKHAN